MITYFFSVKLADDSKHESGYWVLGRWFRKRPVLSWGKNLPRMVEYHISFSHTSIPGLYSIYQSINLSIYQSINLSIYQSINLSIFQSINLSIYQSINLSIYQSINQSSINLSFYQSINLSIYQSINLSIYQSINLRIYQSIIKSFVHWDQCLYFVN